ncbi:winged helix-turn-helix domain-containing protein [Streptomyces monticola]|uniref:Winged helix-turn-helix domain-containing protein n=1 Tax=Streptomyces monticola TaxID=2666263 RepID=A0ABW2JSI4_9ACTN
MSEAPRHASSPAYRHIASVLTDDITSGRIPEGTRLAPERQLAERFGVTRQTVRAALEVLRGNGLVVTNRRGTLVTRPGKRPGAPASRDAVPPGPLLPVPDQPSLRGHLFIAPASADITNLTALAPGSSMLVYQYHAPGTAMEPPHSAVTYFTPAAVLEVAELARYWQRAPVTNPDLRGLHQWCDRAGLDLRITESVTVRRDRRTTQETGPELTIRRWCHDQHGRLLALTELDPPLTWTQVTLEYTDPHARYSTQTKVS